MATFNDLLARLDPDPDPRVRGKQFEHVCKWFLTNDPTYKNMVAEDHDGRLWAIQPRVGSRRRIRGTRVYGLRAVWPYDMLSAPSTTTRWKAASNSLAGRALSE